MGFILIRRVDMADEHGHTHIEPDVPDPFEEGNDIEGAEENARTPAGGTE